MKRFQNRSAWTIAVCFHCICFVYSIAKADDWNGFRGTNGDGTTTETGFPTKWDKETNVKWAVPLPAPGNGSPIVIGDNVILLCAEDKGQKRSTMCFQRSDGTLKWKQTVEYDAVEETHKTNPYCPSTPICNGKHIFVWHRSAGMHCYGLKGNLIWSRDLGKFDHIWGGGSSPVLFEDLVIQLCGPGERTFLVAMDQKTGETRWQTEIEPGGSRSDKGRYVGSWATPMLTKVNGTPQLICPFHTRVVSYNPKTGDEINYILGLHREKSDLCYASPVFGDGYAVAMGGFQGPAFGFKLGGAGDITESHRLWHTGETSNPQRIGSGVYVDGYVYMANADNAGSIECIDIKTGKQTWRQRRTDAGPHWASTIYADGHLFATGQRGTTTIFKADPTKFEVISTNKLDNTCNATPAFSNGELFIRTWEKLYCVSE